MAPLSPSPLAIWLTEVAEPIAADGNYGVDLAIWKLVVIIGVGAVAIIWIIRRVAEVVVNRKTRSIIEQVVGEEAGGTERGWDDLDDLDDPPKRKP